MNRKYFVFLFAVSLSVALAISGCKPGTVDYQVTSFSTLRIMNFATTCGISNTDVSPMDVYVWPVGQSQPTQATALNLAFGGAAVYSNLLPAGTDNILITPHLIHSVDLQTTISLAPQSASNTGKYTFLVSVDPSTGAFVHTLISDGVLNPDTNLAYVRFINLRPNVGTLSVHVDDPVSGDVITANGAFGQVTQYVGIRSRLDTSFAFIVTNASGLVLARLSYQTFTGGNSYTLVYSGDICNTTAMNPADSLESSSDTLRLRAFDDNTLGSDQTFPVTQTFRYNIINDMTPTLYPYNADHPSDTVLGFLVNGAAFPEYFGYSIPPIDVFQAGGQNLPNLVNGAWEVHYQSAVWPNPLTVTAYMTDMSNSFQQQLFTVNVPQSSQFQPVNNGKAYSLLFADTIPSPSVTIGNLDTTMTSQLHTDLIQLPDSSDPNQITIEVISGINPQKPNSSPTTNYSLFYFQTPDGSVTPASSNTMGGLTLAGNKIVQIPLAAGTSEQIIVTDSIGKGGSTALRVPGNTTSFTGQAGGIYEVVSEGTKVNPQLVVIHLN
ncbi:MAG TPA: hypothetical protein VGM92_04495 [Candidatus Kapabacteria bacterium]|jgi:hypothetical protein